MDTKDGWYKVRRQLELTLDTRFRADDSSLIHFDSILSTEQMQQLKYARNFPHLTCLGCGISERDRVAYSEGETVLDAAYAPDSTLFALLPAACYKVYLDLAGSELSEGRVIGCIASCFRNEDKALDAYRAVNFTMKEFVCVGTSEDAVKHVANGIDTVAAILIDMGIEHDVVEADDPFFDNTSSQAVMSKLMPTKREVMFNGHAIASGNLHRRYFGDMFGITVDSQSASTSCVAFGLERWLSMLGELYASPEIAMQALLDVNTNVEARSRIAQLKSSIKEIIA